MNDESVRGCAPSVPVIHYGRGTAPDGFVIHYCFIYFVRLLLTYIGLMFIPAAAVTVAVAVAVVLRKIV